METDTTTVGDTERSYSATKSKYMTPHRGRGKELVEMLRSELGIPEGVKEFEVRFAVDAVVTVRCTYMPIEPMSE